MPFVQSLLAPRWRRLASSALALCMACSCVASDAAPANFTMTVTPDKVAPRDTPVILGVGTHFGIGGEYGYDVDKSVAALHDLGLDSFRDDLAWSWFDSAEIGKGKMPDRLGQFIARSAARPLLIFNHGHPGIDGGKPPQSTAAVAGYADFARRAQAMTASDRPIYEIWNEWNLLDGLKKALNDGAGQAGDTRAATNYIALARKSVTAMRAADPNSTILVGAVGLDPNWTWTKAILAGGILQGASGFSAHLYNHCEGDLTKRTATNAIDTVETLQPLLRKVAGKAVPVYITETGWPTANAGGCAMTQDVSADNLSQMLLWSAATPWIKGIWLYQLKDQGRNPGEPEDNFGIFDYDYRPKAAACTVREAVRLIKSATAWHAERPNPDLFTITAQTNEGPVLISWTSRKEVKATLDFGDHPLRYKALCEGAGGVADKIEIGSRPTIIRLDDDIALGVKVSVH